MTKQRLPYVGEIAACAARQQQYTWSTRHSKTKASGCSYAWCCVVSGASGGARGSKGEHLYNKAVWFTRNASQNQPLKWHQLITEVAHIRLPLFCSQLNHTVLANTECHSKTVPVIRIWKAALDTKVAIKHKKQVVH